MLETISIKDIPEEEKVLLLRELGYDSDGEYVINADGEKVLDKYIDIPIRLESMLIMPGSIIILDNNPVSIASYFEEHPNALRDF